MTVSRIPNQWLGIRETRKHASSARQQGFRGLSKSVECAGFKYYNDAGVDAPWGNAITIPSPPGGLTNPYQGYSGGNPFPQPSPPSKNQVFPSGASYYNYPLEALPTYMMQWNVSYERQAPGNSLVSATYIGNKTTHSWNGLEANPAVYIPGVCSGSPCSSTKNTNRRRVLYLQNPIAGSLISNIFQADMGGNAEYNGLLLKAHHRFSSHYSVVTNYTYSHCISEGDFEGDLGGAQSENPYDSRYGEHGNCGFDFRHLFNASVVAAMPRFSNQRIDKILGNWQLAPIVSIRSGRWFSPSTGVDNSLSGVGLDRPNVAGSPYVRNRSTRQWLNPAAFTPNAMGTFGNAGRDSLVGPGYFDIDVALSRQFNITERQRFQLRFEFFNALNHVSFNNPSSTLSSSTFGIIQSDASPRIIQMAAKYSF